MQCELFKLLTTQPGFNKVYQIFIEPRMTDAKLKSVIPDFIIIPKISRKIVAAAELKYIPFSHPNYQKDLNTLIGFYRLFNENHSYGFPLVTNYINGLYTDEKFNFDEKLILIYCVIAKVDSWMLTHHKELWKLDDDSNYGKINYLQYVGAIPATGDNSWRQINVSDSLGK